MQGRGYMRAVGNQESQVRNCWEETEMLKTSRGVVTMETEKKDG